jgi:hypothetical protein
MANFIRNIVINGLVYELETVLEKAETTFSQLISSLRISSVDNNNGTVTYTFSVHFFEPDAEDPKTLSVNFTLPYSAGIAVVAGLLTAALGQIFNALPEAFKDESSIGYQEWAAICELARKIFPKQ